MILLELLNNIFVNPEVHEIFIKRIGFTLIRVHRQQTFSASNASDEILLQQLKWPVETLFVGMKIEEYNSSTESTRRQHLDKWHRFSEIDSTAYSQDGFVSYMRENLPAANPALPQTVSINVATGVVTGVNTNFGTFPGPTVLNIAAGDYLVVNGHPYEVQNVTSATTLELEGPAPGWLLNVQPLPPVNVPATTDFWKWTATAVSAHVDTCVRTVDNISITAHGIPIYNDFPEPFFNAYMPYHYGGPAVRVPKDCGAMMIPFNLYPGTYQPSGHINVSRAREFYIKYSSSVISSVIKGTLVIIASTIKKICRRLC
jgi:hypothetical protein